MKIRPLLILFLFLRCLPGQSQALDSRTLLTVDGRKTEAGEFIRMYNKSAEPGKKPDVDEYLEQFVLFKLKVSEALREKIDTSLSFKTELKGYRSQLAQNYLTDTQSREKLLKSAYQRSLTEINASHILISLPPDASSADTLLAWNKAQDIRTRIMNGEPFEQVARGSSDDKSVLTNGGNLGYFTVFQMIPPFEDATYSLKKGAISQPVRSAYGYHIIRVNNQRPSRGRVKVAHIMKASPPGTSSEDAKKAADEINSIYEQLTKGGNFRELAAKYSDHKESASRGGEMEWFGTGEVISDFSEAAFALKDTGTFTKPVRTLYGWHIIKLIGRQMPKSFEESRSYLESRINQSYLTALLRKTFLDRLKKEYNFRVNPETFNWFVVNTDTLLIQGLRKYDRSTMPKESIFTFADQRTSASDFASYIEKRGYIIETRDSLNFIMSTLETIAADKLTNYENALLEKKYPEFRYLMNEFHDGILLFEISSKKVWNRVSLDSAGLLKYYEEHKNKYLTNPGIAGKIWVLKNTDGEKSLASAFRKYSAKKDRDERLLKKFNRKSDSILVIYEGRWLKGENKDIDALQWKKGQQQFSVDGFPAIIDITETTEPVPLPFEKVKGEMMTGWQEQLENTWKEELKKKYAVKIDNAVLAEVKKKLSQK